ncbi:STAS-like domain-containing protein [Bradyrhizobium sp. CER78]|uniref:STAS-like domain-containing protein n=1 Tax=Bradyrhizobium sp. CER78 TaxID=3039162 RepID=UPI00244B50FD|nr:STAS-like domain-containing protein [Bradyrhizobium sp. CER78]MDH2382081.1 STAS-like domain-containing protein [Bradyrhizobium sp. CER78]
MPPTSKSSDRSCELSTFGPRIEINGHYDITQFRRLVGAIRELAVDRGYMDIILDFSNCTFTHAPPMLALAAATEYYRDNKIDFELRLPTDDNLGRLFRNSNWAHIIEPDKYAHSEFTSPIHLPALRYRTSDEQHRIVDDILNKILASITDFNRSHFKAIEWSINEITDNVLVHSESQRGGLIQLTSLRSKKRVEFVVCDSGIPKSLKSSGLRIGSDVDALAKAIEQGVTRDKSIGQGNGLYGSYQIAVRSGANFSLHSGNATLYYAPKTGMHTRKEPVYLPGAVVVCAIDYTQPLLLEEALNIRSRGHTPVDMIELKYESTADGNILFVLRNESASFGSRPAGTPVRNKLKNLISFLEGNKVVVDFADIHLVSSSFADEVFGKLFLELGPVEFSTKLELKSIDPTVKLLIEKAIVQRIAAGK